jgi:hypothetical protein
MDADEQPPPKRTEEDSPVAATVGLSVFAFLMGLLVLGALWSTGLLGLLMLAVHLSVLGAIVGFILAIGPNRRVGGVRMLAMSVSFLLGVSGCGMALAAAW